MMTPNVRSPLRGALRCTAALAVFALGAAAPAQDYGDTPYVQTPQNVVDKMLEIAKVGPRDYVIDLGSGDGRIIITAAKKFGARGFGVDLDKRLVTLANRLAARAGVADRAVFYTRDLYDTDVSRATVLTMYLLPEVNLMVRPKLLASLKPGTRIVSHDYDMGDWPPDAQLELDAPGKPVGRDQRSKVFYWVVPGKAAGKWRWRLPVAGANRDYELELDQRFQKISGGLKVDGRVAALQDARLTGEEISFAAVLDIGGTRLRHEFSGRIFSHEITGKVRVSNGPAVSSARWEAARTELREPQHTSAPVRSPWQ